MFQTFNIVESMFQMNLFVALQVARNMSTLSYMAVEISPDPEPTDLPDLVEELAPALLARRRAA